MMLIENSIPVFKRRNGTVEMLVCLEIAGMLNEMVEVELLQGECYFVGNGMVRLRFECCPCKMELLQTALLRCMFDTDNINLN